MKDSKTTINDLARMVNNGFNGVTEEINGVKQEINEVKQEMITHNQRNEQNHLDLKLRLDNVAYRFELQNLEKRMLVLEKKSNF